VGADREEHRERDVRSCCRLDWSM